MIFYIFPSGLLLESDSNILLLVQWTYFLIFQIVIMLPLLDLIFHELVGTLTARAMLACPRVGQVVRPQLP